MRTNYEGSDLSKTRTSLKKPIGPYYQEGKPKKTIKTIKTWLVWML